MLSDESSSDSETGRFKCRTKNEDEQKKSSNREDLRSLGRSRPSGSDRFQRDDRKRDGRDRFDRRSRERHAERRHSPPRRRQSRDRSPFRRSRDRDRERSRPQVEPPQRSRVREQPKEGSGSKDVKRHSSSRSRRSPEQQRDLKEELKRHIKEEVRPAEHRRDLKEELKRHIQEDVKPRDHGGRGLESKSLRKEEAIPIVDRRRETRRELKEDVKYESSKEKRTDKFDRRSRDSSSSPDYKSKRSVVQKPAAVQKQRSHSPIVVEEHDSGTSEEVQLGSYYKLIPAVIKEKEKNDVSPKPVPVKEKSEESSEIDSSDDERLRAKLLNLEKELHKTRKKKHKKKHKKKSSKSGKDKEPTVEVSSTTDIDKPDVTNPQAETAEVSSTQKSTQKESSEEGEISSDDDSQDNYEIDPTDLRHKLKKSTKKSSQERDAVKPEACGPALPPHLQKRYKRSVSPDIEGPALPPHLKNTSKSIGPSIPDDLRKVLAEREQDDVRYVSSDEDAGIGPLPVGAEQKWSDAHKRLEERALDMKIRKLDGHSHHKSDAKSREQWMLELPEGKAKILGLEARSFRAKAGPDLSDRSSWTDTPEEKARKAAGVVKEEDVEVVLQREAKARHIASRDEEQEKAVKKHKKKHKRDESLLEMHEKKLKKKKKKDEKEDKAERRPFSRDVDLQVNRFDEAQKRSIIKKAQDLDSRFGRGEAKYL
ncbi:hypothetical protein O0L34_g8117 [Tuta absoluta]|nr:hypothetical protein O0L34_g8117 [Tuta absoluta]